MLHLPNIQISVSVINILKKTNKGNVAKVTASTSKGSKQLRRLVKKGKARLSCNLVRL